MPAGSGWDSDEKWLKFRAKNPSTFSKIIAKKVKSGVLIHLGLLPSGKWAIQSIHFPKIGFNQKSAKDWLKRMNNTTKGGD